jgi:hypothetical protein
MGKKLALVGQKKSAHKVFAIKPKGKGLLRRYKYGWELNIKYLRGIGWGAIGWIYLTHNGDQWRVL